MTPHTSPGTLCQQGGPQDQRKVCLLLHSQSVEKTEIWGPLGIRWSGSGGKSPQLANLNTFPKEIPAETNNSFSWWHTEQLSKCFWTLHAFINGSHHVVLTGLRWSVHQYVKMFCILQDSNFISKTTIISLTAFSYKLFSKTQDMYYELSYQFFWILRHFHNQLKCKRKPTYLRGKKEKKRKEGRGKGEEEMTQKKGGVVTTTMKQLKIKWQTHGAPQQ